MLANFNFTDLITVPFGMFLDLLYRLTSNYGAAIILFAVCVSILLHPLRLINAVSGAKKARLQPKVAAIRKMFPGNTSIQNKIVEDLYFEKEKIKPYSVGILTTVIPIAILLVLFGVVRQPLVNMLGVSRTQATTIFNMIDVLRPGEFGDPPVYNEFLLVKYIPQYKEMVMQVFPMINERVFEGINFSFLGLDLSQVPNMDFAAWETNDWAHIGLAILPVLAATANVIPKLIRSFVQMFSKKSTDTKKTNGGFNIFSAVLTLLFIFACFQVPAAISLYWLTQSIVNIILRLHIRHAVNNLPPEACDLETLVAPYRDAAKTI